MTKYLFEERFLRYVHMCVCTYIATYVNLVLPFIVGDKRIWSNAAKVSSCFKLVSESYVCM